MRVIITEPHDSSASSSSRGEIEEIHQGDRHVAADLTTQTAVPNSNTETQLMRAKPKQQHKCRVKDSRSCFGSSSVIDCVGYSCALKRGTVEERTANMESLLNAFRETSKARNVWH